MKASIIIRTYNEDRHLESLLEKVSTQDMGEHTFEVILVDSGSEDNTLKIAERFNTRILHISKEEFTFGRSLNIGCAAATGDYLVFISGHCVPTTDKWLFNLVMPLHENACAYSYGCQLGADDSKFSEHQLFKKYYPESSKIPQNGYFCNNANAALKYEVWEVNHFNEELTGLEDMELAKRLVDHGYKIGYVADAPVLHIHEENWKRIFVRYEREAIALQDIMPEVHVNFLDFLRYFSSAVLLDMGAALNERVLRKSIYSIFMFRLMQFFGSYKGNHEVRKLSHEMKEKYFFPK
ncbi:MAG: glycosyltransferase [Candidatus Thiodiazotropha sp.]